MTPIIYNIRNAVYKDKMASFDYDWTLVNPKLAKTFPKDIDDWEWIYPNVVEKIKEYHDQGYMIVIFTNQSKSWKCEQIKTVAELLCVPVFVVIATDKKHYKPNPLLFNLLCKTHSIDKSNSFFVGDALGRKADFSDSDKVFAETIGIKWFPPEQIFRSHNIIYNIPNIPLSNKQEIIIMTGFPGSGKTTIANHICKHKDYIHIQGDIYKNSKKMIKASLDYIKQNKSIVFDATNSSIKKRKEYIDIASLYNIGVMCIHVSTSLNISFKRNRMRNDKSQVPKIAYSVFSKHFDKPSENEGFTLYTVS